MITQIYDWIKSIIFYLIIITAVFNSLPSDKYKKYIRFFTGIILIGIVIAPLKSFLNNENIFDNIYEIQEFSQATSNFKKDMEKVDYIQNESIENEYKEKLSEQVKSVGSSYGVNIENVEIEIEDNSESEDYLTPLAIKIKKKTAAYDNFDTKTTLSPSEIDFINNISKLYQIDEEKIEIE